MSLISVCILLVCTIHIHICMVLSLLCNLLKVYKNSTLVHTGICGQIFHLSSTFNTVCFCYLTVGTSNKTKSDTCNLLLLLLHHHHHHQVLQLQCLTVLALSAASLHLTLSWMHFVQLFIFIILKPSFIPFSHLLFGLPANLVDISFHSYSFLTTILFVIRSAWPN